MIYVEKREFASGIPYVSLIIEGPQSLRNFQTLINRAMNTWDFAPVEMKEFADTFQYGKPLQDYEAQAAHLPVRATPKDK